MPSPPAQVAHARSIDAATSSAPARARADLPLTARRHPLVATVARQLRLLNVLPEHGLGMDGPTGETRLVIGVSGGPDSVALLLAVHAIAARREMRPARFRPIAVHVHHHLREAADDDAAFVQSLCVRFGIEARIEHVHPSGLSGNRASNARRLRYEALAKAAREAGARFVAVAHHAEDQLESMLMALCRGAGLDGLTGIAPARSLDESLTLIRPLLGVRKAECEELCTLTGIPWRQDPSNRDATRARARLRRDVLPVLEALWPDAPRRACAAAELVEAARLALKRQLQGIFGPAHQREWPRDALRNQPRPIIAAGLRRAALAANPALADGLGQRHLLAAASAIRSTDRRPKRFGWPGGLFVKITSKKVSLEA